MYFNLQLKSFLSVSLFTLFCLSNTEIICQNQTAFHNKNVPYVILKDMESSYLALGKQNDNKLYLCFVFETPCFPCNDNIPFWESIFTLTNNSITCFGVLNPDQSDDFSALKKRVNYKIYVPEEIEAFREAFHLEKEHQAITFLYRNNTILEFHIGNFDGQTFTNFVNRCKQHIYSKSE